MSENNPKPYTIRLFMPTGTPNSCKIIDKMNWTGIGIEVSRQAWDIHKTLPEFELAGVYILFGYEENSEMPTVYIGQGDPVKGRIDSHNKHKLFWDKAIAFVSSNKELNRAHITWLEWALICKAKEYNRCILANDQIPGEPTLRAAEKADTEKFLYEILSILPLIEIKVFEQPSKIHVGETPSPVLHKSAENIQDTVIVPANRDGFEEEFLGNRRWYAIRIGGAKLHEIKYIAAYQTAPVSAITHYAEVDSIVAFGDGEKYMLIFKSPATELPHAVKFADAKKGSLQGPRYTNLKKLLISKSVKELFE